MKYFFKKISIFYLFKCEYTCPDYKDIALPSVSAENFDINEFSGHWYAIASNEPTMPSFCLCENQLIDVHKDAD